MQIRIASDQPWSVEADVLAVPLTLDEPAALDAEILAELDRRLGGGLAAYREFGELKAKAHKAGMLRASGMGAGWLLGVGAGSAASSTGLRPCAWERRSSGGWRAGPSGAWRSGFRAP